MNYPYYGSDQAPAGWYPTPDGGQRYWDGQQWLAIPAPDAAEQPRNRHRAWMVAIAVVIAVVVLGGGAGLFFSHRAQERAEAAAAASAQAAEEEASAEAAEQASRAAEEEAQRDAERAARAEAVTEIEKSVKTMAEEHIEEGILDGPEVLDVTCSPVAGGSIDDLAEETTVLSCFVATKDNGDGTMRGSYYNATMNWTTGEYTYGLGRP